MVSITEEIQQSFNEDAVVGLNWGRSNWNATAGTVRLSVKAYVSDKIMEDGPLA